MVQLKQVSMRLKSIKNIQKITKTMKMVSASKFTRAERELRAARPFGYGPRKFYESTRLIIGAVDVPKEKPQEPPKEAEVKPEDKEAEKKMKKIFIAVTSDRDGHHSQISQFKYVNTVQENTIASKIPNVSEFLRILDNPHTTKSIGVEYYIRVVGVVIEPSVYKGLCGGVHSGVSRRIRREMALRPTEPGFSKIVCIGDKSRAMLRRQFADNMLVSVKDIGRISPVFLDASRVAAAVTEAGYTYDSGEILYNKFFSAVKYELSMIPFFNKAKINAAPNMSAFDDVEDDLLESYSEWTLAALLYFALKEGAASEQSARMSAMDNATKNASEMIRKLTLLFNRTRQAVITRELIEIISGAAALK